MKQRFSTSGFSLLELSVVMAILAVVAVVGVAGGQNALRGSARLGTQERLALIKEALDAYAARNGYLPCPADPALLPSSASFGVESRSGSAGAGCLASGAIAQVSSVWFGTLPARNLGLDDSYVTDSWGGKLLYAVSNNHVGASGSGFSSYALNNGTIAIRAGTRATLDVTNYLITTNPSTGAPGDGATYVVVSFGRNQRGAYPLNATAVALACGADATLIEVENCDRSNNTFYDVPYNEGAQAATQFDDFIVWGTNITQRHPATATPGCPSGCDTWCAPCETTNPATSAEPSPLKRLCAKFVSKTYPDCKAVCIWSSDTSPCP